MVDWYHGHPALVDAADRRAQRKLQSWELLGRGAGTLMQLYKGERDKDRQLGADTIALEEELGHRVTSAQAKALQESAPEAGYQLRPQSVPFTETKPSTFDQDGNVLDYETTELTGTAPSASQPVSSSQPGGAHPEEPTQGDDSSYELDLNKVRRATTDAVEPLRQSSGNFLSRVGEMFGVETEGRTSAINRLAQLEGQRKRQGTRLKTLAALANTVSGAVDSTRAAKAIAPESLSHVPDEALEQAPTSRASKVTKWSLALEAADGDPKKALELVQSIDADGGSGMFPDKKMESIRILAGLPPAQRKQFIDAYGDLQETDPLNQEIAERMRQRRAKQGMTSSEQPPSQTNAKTLGSPSGAFPAPDLDGRVSQATAPFESFISQSAQKWGVDPSLVRRVIYRESRGNPRAVGRQTKHGTAKGAMQLIDSTAAEMGVADVFDAEQNIDGGTQYLSIQLGRFGDPVLAAAAYNAGPEAVEQYGGVPPFPETIEYIAEIFGPDVAARYTNNQQPAQSARGPQQGGVDTSGRYAFD